MAALERRENSAQPGQVHRTFPQVLLRWPSREMSGEAFKCEIELWDRVEGEPGPLEICYSELGPTLGGSESAARRWIKALVAIGLVRRIDGRLGPNGGVYVHVCDPGEAFARRHVRKVSSDPQDELPFDDEDSEAQFGGFETAGGTDDLTHPEVVHLVASDGDTAGGTAEITPPVVAQVVASDGGTAELFGDTDELNPATGGENASARQLLSISSKEEIQETSSSPPPSTSSDSKLRFESFEDLERWLFEAHGLDLADAACAALVANGCDLATAARCVEHFERRWPAWGAGALHHRLLKLTAGDDVTRGWPKADPAAAKQRQARRRQTAAAGARADDRQRQAENAAWQTTLARYAPWLDGLATDAAEGLVLEAFADNAFFVALAHRQGFAAPLVRDQLVAWLVAQGRAPPAS